MLLALPSSFQKVDVPLLPLNSRLEPLKQRSEAITNAKAKVSAAILLETNLYWDVYTTVESASFTLSAVTSCMHVASVMTKMSRARV
mmetsp:Transcript_12723/g.23640  ORF Transcript_12723/g.23640 Transcript_12723/m.23640 type:complete len:87 (+) Transcript_12723:290-550(+)